MSLEAVIEKVGPLEQGKQLQIAKLSIEELKPGLVKIWYFYSRFFDYRKSCSWSVRKLQRIKRNDLWNG